MVVARARPMKRWRECVLPVIINGPTTLAWCVACAGIVQGMDLVAAMKVNRGEIRERKLLFCLCLLLS